MTGAVPGGTNDPVYEWGKSRRVRRLDNPSLIIEYVPGPTPYFWLGECGGDYWCSINADALAGWIDSIRARAAAARAGKDTT